MRVWTLVDTTYNGQEYPKGSSIDLPRNTDEEKAEFEKMVSYGVVTKKSPEPDEKPEGEKRAGRSRKD